MGVPSDIAGFRVELFSSGPRSSIKCAPAKSLSRRRPGCSPSQSDRLREESHRESTETPLELRRGGRVHEMDSWLLDQDLAVQQKAFHCFKMGARQCVLEASLLRIRRRSFLLLWLGAFFCLFLAAAFATKSGIRSVSKVHPSPGESFTGAGFDQFCWLEFLLRPACTSFQHVVALAFRKFDANALPEASVQ
jgi:hypothetical protein